MQKSPSIPKHLPVDTFDAWLTKQVRASKKEGPAKSPERQETVRLPESTFDEWMKKQKPKESAPEKRETTATPDTFEVWINKKVAERTAEESHEEQISVAVSGTTSAASSLT